LSTKDVGSRRELVANRVHCSHRRRRWATQLDSCVASAVCIGHDTGFTFSCAAWQKASSGMFCGLNGNSPVVAPDVRSCLLRQLGYVPILGNHSKRIYTIGLAPYLASNQRRIFALRCNADFIFVRTWLKCAYSLHAWVHMVGLGGICKSMSELHRPAGSTCHQFITTSGPAVVQQRQICCSENKN